jgi:hypothetical protein
MFVPKSGTIGATLSAVAILISAGLLLPPAVSFAGPEETTSRIALPVTRLGTAWH